MINTESIYNELALSVKVEVRGRFKAIGVDPCSLPFLVLLHIPFHFLLVATCDVRLASISLMGSLGWSNNHCHFAVRSA